MLETRVSTNVRVDYQVQIHLGGTVVEYTAKKGTAAAIHHIKQIGGLQIKNVCSRKMFVA